MCDCCCLSATVGNSAEFLNWLQHSHGRKLTFVESKDRKIPLTYVWVPDQLLNEQLVLMASGDDEQRRTPALVFCFNRDECWSVAEQLKGLPLVTEADRTRLHAEVNKLDWTAGIGPKLKQMLHRGVGVHHAGLLPKYRRVVEELFQKKLLAVAVCTETLAAGINSAGPIRGCNHPGQGPIRQGEAHRSEHGPSDLRSRRQTAVDDRGYVYVLAPEDDVKLLRWREKYDQIPENTPDPNLRKAKKALLRKKPSRSDLKKYWSESQFKQLQGAPPGKLYSKGPLPWRLLAYLLKVSPEVGRIRTVIRKRLMDEPRIKAGEKVLERMLLTLAEAGYVTLEPTPPVAEAADPAARLHTSPLHTSPLYKPSTSQYWPMPRRNSRSFSSFAVFIRCMVRFWSINLASPIEMNASRRWRASLDCPDRYCATSASLGRIECPPGPLATTRLDPELINRGLIAAKPVIEPGSEEEEPADEQEQEFPPTLADKLRLYFDTLYPYEPDLITQSVWAAGELLNYGGDFNQYVQTHDLVKQEGIIFRHLLRLILLCGEFNQVTPPDTTSEAWRGELNSLAESLTASCRAIDPTSTDQLIELAHAADVVEGEAAK